MSPPHPQEQWCNYKCENRTRRCDQSKKFLIWTTSNIKIPGQGDTHRKKMKFEASSQITDTVVIEWQFACERHGFVMLSQNWDLCWRFRQHEPESCFHMYKLEQTRITRPIVVVTRRKATGASQKVIHVPLDTSQWKVSGKALACWSLKCTNIK